MKIFQFLLLAVIAGLLFYTVLELPPRGALDAPSNRAASLAQSPVAGTYYVENAYADTKTPNMVAVILADYRSVDTMGEVVVVFAGLMVCFFILRRRPW